MNKKTTIALLTGGIALGLAGNTLAQSSDALLNKLVSKGVLNQQEADELKKEANAGFDKAYRSRTGLPDWVNSLKIYGDVRGRYDFITTDNAALGVGEPNKDRGRFRYRLRAGMTATFKDNFELGFRLTSSEPNADGTGGDPISGNTTMQNNGSKKFVYIDTAYGKWTPINTDAWTLGATIGKMDNPFVVSDMVFDHDYTPEGGALMVGYNINKSHGLKLIGGYFLLDEINQGAQASDDPIFYGAQLRYDAKWTKELSTSAGVSWMALANEENLNSAAVPNIQGGNTRHTAAVGPHAIGDLVYQYAPIILDLSATYSMDKFPGYNGAFPIKVGGEFMYNTGAARNNRGYWGGVTLGKAAKKNTWELGYRYKVLEEDAWYEEFVDSDFGAYRQVAFTGDTARGYRAGTGVQGHVTKVAYALSDSFLLSATWFFTESVHPAEIANKETESATHRLQLDASWKF